jgi:predicted HD phosphohydrolase
MEKMHYTRMDEGTDADFQVLKHVHEKTLRLLPDCLFGLLRDLAKDTAYNITRYDHCLQAATRALRDGKDEEYVAYAPGNAWRIPCPFVSQAGPHWRPK